MYSFRRLVLALLVVALAVGGGATAWLTGAGAATASSTNVSPPGTQPHGVNFSIHSEVDVNYCLEDIPAPAVPASQASMSQCAARNGQRWTFADPANGSIVLIGGNFGNCLDASANVSSPISDKPCSFKAGEQFYYSSIGQIESTSGKKCLQAAQSTQDATVFIAKCSPTVPLQIWQLSH
jgi:hypothetical protein